MVWLFEVINKLDWKSHTKLYLAMSFVWGKIEKYLFGVKYFEKNVLIQVVFFESQLDYCKGRITCEGRHQQ